MALPKVLIFNQSFNRHSGGGITLINLFKNWPKENISVLCSGHMVANSDADICNNYYQLGTQEHQYTTPFDKLQKKFISGPVIIQPKQETHKAKSKPALRNKFIDTIFFPFLRFTGIFYKISSIHLSDKLKNWLRDFKPDVLYIQVSERDAILFASELLNYLKIPTVIHIMDDWPSTVVPKGIFKKYWSKKIDAEFRQLLKACSVRLSISEDMAEEYFERYGEHFIPFHNPIDIGFWKKHQRNNYALSSKPSLLYAGRIGLGIDESLENIAKAIDKVNEELHSNLKFVLQTHEKPSWFKKYSCLAHSDFVRYEDLPQKFAEADFLILPYDFSQKAINFIRLSMPTKAPEYMISGTPVIVFAPGVTAISKSAKKYKWAKLVTNNNVEDLADEIKQLFMKENERKKVAEIAKSFAETNFDVKLVTQRFQKTFIDLCSNVSSA